MTAEEKLKEPTYGIAAIEDWKAGRISRDRLFEIFRVNLFVGYGYINDDDKTRTTTLTSRHSLTSNNKELILLIDKL